MKQYVNLNYSLLAIVVREKELCLFTLMKRHLAASLIIELLKLLLKFNFLILQINFQIKLMKNLKIIRLNNNKKNDNQNSSWCIFIGRDSSFYTKHLSNPPLLLFYIYISNISYFPLFDIST